MRNILQCGMKYFFLTLIALFAGCSTTSCPQTATQQPQLLQANWQLEALHDASIPAPITLQFFSQTHHVAGFSGCNRFMGRYFIKSGFLQFEQITTTKMACNAPNNGLEEQFIAALDQTLYYCIEANTLRLQNSEKETLMRFKRIIAPEVSVK